MQALEELAKEQFSAEAKCANNKHQSTQKVKSKVSGITRANDALELWMPLTKAKKILECEEMPKVDAF